MLKLLLILVIIAVVVFAVIVSQQPDDFRIERSMTIAASPADIHAQINDLHKWNAWSPWAKMDPNSKVTFTGPNEGTNSAMRWESDNNNVGVGTMTITESKPGELVRMRLDFEKPMTASNIADFTMTPEGDKTKVTWSMLGKNNFIAKAFSLVMNCDKMVGGMFEQGLASIKSIVETKN